MQGEGIGEVNRKKLILYILVSGLMFLNNFISAEELEPRLELGFNMGAMTVNNRESYFGESSYLYPEVGAWVNLGEKARFGITTGFIYVDYADIAKTISVFPTMLEMSVLHVESGLEYQEFFMELGLGVGFFLSVGDVYRNANAWSLKIGTGFISEELMFSINAKIIGCNAIAENTFSYIIKPPDEIGNISEEMDLGGVAVTIGVGTRF
jgi:hypothetical protein